ncbi:cysteine peptidase family C39 domain-containing protein [Metaplanococcus flavidus]|uniref:Peptidase C39-like domain-containing protein n=1 Tax=Metaplanococcus flavidus TaxID=569883 RepID=A0ABW3LDN8_9BACL
MKVLLPFEGMSQYEPAIDPRKRGSACGPVTAASIFNFHENEIFEINEVYRLLGTTPIGLFTWRFLRNFRKIAGGRYRLEKTRSISDVKKELLSGRPLAMKFDRYFTFRWLAKPLFNYHWVPLIGFEDKGDDVVLYFHDNGKRNRPSKIRTVSYHDQRTVLSFVKIVPSKPE